LRVTYSKNYLYDLPKGVSMSLFGTILEKIGITKPAATMTAAPASDKAKIDATVHDAMEKAEAEAKARVAAQTTATPDTKAPAVSASATPSVATGPATPTTSASSPAPTPPVSAPSPAPLRPAAVSMVDVMSKLEGLSRSHPGLNWKVSIVDLLKLLDMDSSIDARQALAVELGCPPNLINDSASMNIWLHKTVLEKIAENGGNIPTTMLDNK
jgi:hypothetical protein